MNVKWYGSSLISRNSFHLLQVGTPSALFHVAGLSPCRLARCLLVTITRISQHAGLKRISDSIYVYSQLTQRDSQVTYGLQTSHASKPYHFTKPCKNELDVYRLKVKTNRIRVVRYLHLAESRSGQLSTR